MVLSRALPFLTALVALTLTSGCDAGDDSAADAPGVYSLDQTPASEQDVAPPQDSAAPHGATDSGDPTDPGDATDPGDTTGPGGPEDAGGTQSPVNDDDENRASGQGGPSGTQDANPPTSPAPAPDTDEETTAEQREHRPLAADSQELAAFQREVVALPAGYDGSVFTPPGQESVTVANRYTDRLSHVDAVAFMREALENAGWRIADQQEARRDTVRLDAARSTESATVLIELAASRASEPDVVVITVEHTT